MKKLNLFVFCISVSSFVYSQGLFGKKTNNPKTQTEVEEVVKVDDIVNKTKGCDVFAGLFTIYQDKDNGKSYIEIDTSHLGNEFIHFSYIENGVMDAWAFKGNYRGSKIIEINKFYDKIEFTVKNTKYYFDDTNPLSKASHTNINSPIVVSEKIIATGPEKTRFLISADNIFLTESLQQIKASYPPTYRGFRLGNLSTKTRYNKIRSYPENTDVVVNYFFESRYPSNRGSDAITDARNVSIMVQHSLIKMPDDNYNPRVDDTRVGYFTTRSNDMTSLERLNYRDFINRWRLEKKDPEKALSDPVKPIVWWIENTTPYEFRDIIKEGVEMWNIAFEKAGFTNAVQVKIQPDTAEWDAGDIRYNVLRWNSSPNPPFSGYGPSFVNPRTGEILGSDIMLEWVYVTGRVSENLLYNENESDHHDHHMCSAARYQQIENALGFNYIKSMDLSEEMKRDFLNQALKRLVLHEVGHTLGLSHNFKGSTMLSTAELNNKDIVNARGVCNSVMEYPATNIAKDPDNQGLFFDIKPGPYDIWVIEYGYSEFNDSIPIYDQYGEDSIDASGSIVFISFLKNEIESLERILNRSTEKDLAFANDAFDMRSPGKGTDPNAMIYDLSSDQLTFSENRIEMVTNILQNLKDKYTKDNDTYEELYRAYRTLVYSYFQSLEVVSRQIGGVKVDLSHTDQNSSSKPFESVDKETQMAAMQMISDYGFSNKVLLQEDLFPYLQKQRRGWSISDDPTIHQRILIYQNRLLNHLLHPNVLLRMTNSSLYGNEYKLPDYMIDLRKSIFQSDMYGNVSTVRQNLQITYVNRLLSIVGPKSKYDNVSKTTAHYNLNWLKNNLNINTGDLASRQHKGYILHIINDILNNEK